MHVASRYDCRIPGSKEYSATRWLDALCEPFADSSSQREWGGGDRGRRNETSFDSNGCPSTKSLAARLWWESDSRVLELPAFHQRRYTCSVESEKPPDSPMVPPRYARAETKPASLAIACIVSGR